MSEYITPANRLLAALPAEEYRQLLSKSEEVSLNFKEILYAPGEIIRDVYFPGDGIVSLFAAAGERSQLEIGIVGSEGMIGLPVFLGVKNANNQALVQSAGAARRVKTEDFLTQCNTNGSSLIPLLQRYTHSLLTQVSQSAVCNRFHSVESQLARRLLMTSERMESADFQITQEFLSNILGVRREAVTLAASNLQRSELISYSRGKVSILDPTGLAAAACACYLIIKQEYEQNSE